MHPRTTSSSWASTIVRALELEGLDCQLLFQQLGLDYHSLQDPDARFTQDAMSLLWNKAAQLSGNPAIALSMAKVVRPTSFHVLGYALMSSRNLYEGFQRLVRFQRIIAESADLSLHKDGNSYELRLLLHGDRLPITRHSAEASLAYCLAFCRWLSRDGLNPLEVSFQSPMPVALEPYQALFQAPLKFAQAHFALRFASEDFEAPLASANEALAQLHERFAGEYLARFDGGKVTHQVRQVLCRLLPQGEPRRELVAQSLHLSERTLQRRLADEGSSYQQLLDDTRRELAEQYLGAPQMTLLEIAYLLGFADPSNFFRAFRRWFATTPSEYRTQVLSMAPEARQQQHQHGEDLQAAKQHA